MNEKYGCEGCGLNDNYGLLYVNECNDGILGKEYKIKATPQYQTVQPGIEYLMEPKPIFDNPNYKGSDKLKGKVAVITGGDSGIGRAVTIYFAKEGANIVISYLNEHEDANYTKQIVESCGRRCILIPGDLRDENLSTYIVDTTMSQFGKIDVLINNCGVQFPQNSILDI